MRIVGCVEALPEAGAERAVVDGAADLDQPFGAAPGPTHLLSFGHPAVDQEIGRALSQRRADPFPRPVPLGVVDQPVTLAGEVVVQRHLVAWIGGVDALSPTRLPGHAVRTYSGRPR